MLLERYYDDSLAQASYLLGCEQTREAIVVDPNRDVDRYVRAAAAHRMRIVYVTETHIHADFLSGSRDLARAAKAKLLLSGHGGESWSYRFADEAQAQLMKDGDAVTLGRVRLDVRHTPGHTPEHIVFLVTDGASGDRPMGMISGDFVFVGDVGRPDLLERAAKMAGTMEDAARQLYASLQRLADLPDYLQIWPGHGAGSACGKALGAVPQSTLGYERLFNPAFRQTSEDAFVRWVLADQPEAPPYFAVMKRLNRDGPPSTATNAAPQLDATALQAAIAAKQWVVDIRGSSDFARAHLPGSINIPGASKSFVSYAGTVLPYDRPIAIVGKTREHAEAAIRQLALIGLDQIAGWAAHDVLQQIQSDGNPLASLRRIEPEELSEQLQRNGPRVIDVRGRAEWNEGHLPKATHIYLGDLAERSTALKHDEPIVVHCESGTRSSIAASLLAARGFRDVTNFVGGFAAWQKAGLPVEKP
jgi:hydroxyacylglutathione hydrolase